jgi:hypothetical protein
VFIGSKIIITSYKPLKDWYINITEENKKQLYRRISTLLVFNLKTIDVMSYSEEIDQYVKIAEFKNPINYDKKDLPKNKLQEFEEMGFEITNYYTNALMRQLEIIEEDIPPKLNF